MSAALLLLAGGAALLLLGQCPLPLLLLLLLLLVLLAACLLAPPPPAMFAVYSQPGPLYPLKWAAFRLLLALRSARAGRAASREGAGYGVRSLASAEQMERVQPLADHPLALDSVWMQGVSPDGGWLVAGAARRPAGRLDAVLLVGLPGVGTLCLPRHPDTVVAGGSGAFAGAGLRIWPEEPMRRWRVAFAGQLRRHPSGQLVDVALDLRFTSNMPHFDYDTDMSAAAVSRAMAREPWSRQFFGRLRDAHQTHYEQLGTASGTVTVAGHQHALRIGVVSQPYNFSRIELGYVYTPGAVRPIDWCDLELGYHGEQGTPPTDYGFSFGAGGRTYHVQVTVLEAHTVYCGADWEARLLERPCRYRLDDQAGWGMAEWQYRHNGGRPARYPLPPSEQDGQPAAGDT
ncbi:hypothetical protein FJT64_016782 [Amphibalanus amphitrite]|nr:hypothetical protein FJT64_016782 [Amphibalanus amphitrite]